MLEISNWEVIGLKHVVKGMIDPFIINAGPDHRKFMRAITVYLDITAPLYWWKEFDTYKIE